MYLWRAEPALSPGIHLEYHQIVIRLQHWTTIFGWVRHPIAHTMKKEDITIGIGIGIQETEIPETRDHINLILQDGG